jgi:hypothetical protein
VPDLLHPQHAEQQVRGERDGEQQDRGVRPEEGADGEQRGLDDRRGVMPRAVIAAITMNPATISQALV